MSGTASGKSPRSAPQWVRDITKRVRALENPRTLRFGSWVISTGDNGMPRFTKPGETIETGETEPVSVSLPRGTIISDEDITEAITGTPGPLEAISLFLQGKWNPLDTMQSWWQQTLDGFGVPDVAGWLLDLLGIKSQAQTAWTNAANALGQFTSLLSNAAQSTVANLGNAIKGTVNNFADILTGFGLGSVANWITDLLGTKSTAGTAASNAASALGQIGQFLTAAAQATMTAVGNAVKGTVNNFADILTGFGLGSVANWITDLLGTKSTAGTASTNASNALGQLTSFFTNAGNSLAATVGGWLATARTQAQNAATNFANILSGFGLGAVGDWITDLLGTKSTAGTASTNASNALGQLTSFFTNAGNSLAATVGGWLATARTQAQNAATNFANILSGFGLGAVGDWITDLLGTKSTASTAGTNASNALGQLTSFFTNAGNSVAATVGGWLATARSQAQTAIGNFTDILSGFGLGTIGNWISDLLGTKSTAGTASTNASNALGQWTSYIAQFAENTASAIGTALNTARNNAATAISNFTSIFSNFSVPNIGSWINDLLGTKSTASTAGTNAGTALGNWTTFLSNAVEGTVATVGQAVANARNSFSSILSGFSLPNIGSWVTDLLGTKSTANTASTNASTAVSGLATANTKLSAKIRAADELTLDPNIENADIWAGAFTGVVEVSTDVALVGTQSLKLTAGGTTTIPVVYFNADGQAAVTNRGWAVRPGQRHYYGFRVWRPAGTNTGTIRVQNRISVTGTATDTYPAVLSVSVATLPVEQWTLIEGIYTMPATLTVESQARVPIDNSPRIIWDGNPTAGQVLYVGRVSAKDVTDTQNITDRMWEGLTGGVVTTYKTLDDAKLAASGVKSVSDTASTNASNALGQWTSYIGAFTENTAAAIGSALNGTRNNLNTFLSNAVSGTAATVGQAVKNAADNFSNILSGFSLPNIGSWINDLLGTKSTASTASSNASTANANAIRADRRSKTLYGSDLIIDPLLTEPDQWTVSTGWGINTSEAINRFVGTATGTTRTQRLTALGVLADAPKVDGGARMRLTYEYYRSPGNTDVGNVGVVPRSRTSSGAYSGHQTSATYSGQGNFVKGAWTKVEHVFTTHTDAVALDVYAEVHSGVPSGQTFSVRNVSLREETTAQNIITDIQAGAEQLGQNVQESINKILGVGKDASAASSDNAAQIAALQANQNGSENNGRSIGVDIGEYANGNPPSVWTKVRDEIGGGVVVSNGRFEWSKSGGGSGVELWLYNALNLTSDYEEVAAVTPSNGETDPFFNGNWGFRIVFLRSNLAGSHMVLARFAYNSVRIGYYAGGSLVWATNEVSKSVPAGSIIKLRAGTVGGLRVFQALVGNTVAATWTDSSNATSVGASFRYGGVGLQPGARFAGGQNSPGSISFFTLSDRAPAAVVGHGLSVYRGTTSAATWPANDTPLAGGFFDTVEAQTDDILWNAATSTATVTVGDWYTIDWNARRNTDLGRGNAAALALFVNGALKRRGQMLRAPDGASTNSSYYTVGGPLDFSMCTSLYLPAGSTIQPGTVASASATGAMPGNANGDLANFTIVRGKQT